MSMLGILNIGTTALMASQSALNTTSNNIANASTAGYTRQEAVLTSIPSGIINSTGSSGNGVTVDAVKRMYDSFTTLQLRTEKSNSSYWSTYSGYAGSIQTMFNETSGTGIEPAISDFFNAWQTLAQNPQGTVERSSLISKAQYLGSRINGAFNDLSNHQAQIYTNSQNLVTQLNGITKQIYNLNEQIVSSPGANDLLDQRDSLIEQLNQISGVSTVQDNSGRYSVYVGGTTLVDATGSYDMSVSIDASNKMQFNVGSTDITSSLTGGQIKANLDARDTAIQGYMNQLNAFAIGVSDAVNNTHRTGYGLDGSTGNNFFTSLVKNTDSGTTGINSTNVTDASAFNYDKYEIDYTAAGNTFSVYDLSTDPTKTNPIANSVAHSGNTTTLTFNGIDVGLGGNNATMTSDEIFTVQLDPNAARDMSVAVTDPQKIAAASSNTGLPGDNTNAQNIANLVSQNITGNTDPVSFYSNIVSSVGADAQSAGTYVNFQSALVNQLESQRQSTSGVNLDEEAANLVQYQKSYEAAAKMITMASDLLDSIIGMIR